MCIVGRYGSGRIVMRQRGRDRRGNGQDMRNGLNDLLQIFSSQVLVHRQKNKIAVQKIRIRKRAEREIEGPNSIPVGRRNVLCP